MARHATVINQVRAVRNALRVIERAIVQGLRVAPQPHVGTPGRTTGRTLRLSPARRAQLKLQGQYMGYARQLKPKQKAQIKALKEKKGYPAAIRLAKRLAGV